MIIAQVFNLKSQIYEPIAFPEKVDKKYVIDPLKEQEKYAKKLKKTMSKREVENFSASNAFAKSEIFLGGEVYLSWPDMEEYLNHVLDSIMPSTLINKKIRAYVGRNSSINAYCLYDGTMVVNVGLIAEVKNEAALAIIMAHELEHYIKGHLLSRYKKTLKKNHKNQLEDNINYQGHSQENELEADEQGFALAKNANYDLEQGLNNFELFIREEEYYKKRNSSTLVNADTITVKTAAGKFKANTLEKLLSSHPQAKDRKDKLVQYIKEHPQKTKQKFKFKEDTFKSLQAKARLESVYLIYNSNDYQECLERAFIFHLFNPNELTYDYYAAECIRKLCLLDYRLRKKGFLTDKLTNDGFNEGQGILHDLKYLIPNAELFNQIKNIELKSNKTIAFETYKEAFYYFTKKMLDKNEVEAHLLEALFENNKTKISNSVTKYLANGKSKHKEFAMAYKNNQLTEKVLNFDKEILMIPKVNFFRNYQWPSFTFDGFTSYYYKKSELVGKQMSIDFAKYFDEKVEGVQSISLPQAAIENFNTKYNYETIMSRTWFSDRDENEGYQVQHYYKQLVDEDYNPNLDLFRFDPQCWEFFMKNKISAISMAKYTRHYIVTKRKLRNLMIFLAPITTGTTLLFIPFIRPNCKLLTMYGYDAALKTNYYQDYLQVNRLNARKAKKMLVRTKAKRKKLIKEYNEKY